MAKTIRGEDLDPAMSTYDDDVMTFMAVLNSRFSKLYHSPFIRSARRGVQISSQRHKEEAMTLLTSLDPVTETEKIIAATFRWIAAQHRSSFIDAMVSGKFMCASTLLRDHNMIEMGLGVKNSILFGPAPAGPHAKQQEHGPRGRDGVDEHSFAGGHRRHNSAGAGVDENGYVRVNRRRSRNRGHRRRTPQSTPVLNDRAQRNILEKLEDDLAHEPNPGTPYRLFNEIVSTVQAEAAGCLRPPDEHNSPPVHGAEAGSGCPLLEGRAPLSVHGAEADSGRPLLPEERAPPPVHEANPGAAPGRRRQKRRPSSRARRRQPRSRRAGRPWPSTAAPRQTRKVLRPTFAR